VAINRNTALKARLAIGLVLDEIEVLVDGPVRRVGAH
jgi:hypothetical protein